MVPREHEPRRERREQGRIRIRRVHTDVLGAIILVLVVAVVMAATYPLFVRAFEGRPVAGIVSQR